MSKIGPHFLGSSPNMSDWLSAKPRLIKFDPTTLGYSVNVPPGILVVGKLDQQDTALGLTDWKALFNQKYTPNAAALKRFHAQTNIYIGPNKPRLNRYEANPRIDVWEDDNEVVPDNPGEAVWYSAYCIEMMKLYESIGKKRANFSFAVGTPNIDIWPHLISAVRYIRDNGHYIALHEYMGYEANYGVGWNQVDAQRKPISTFWHGRKKANGTPDETYPYGWTILRYRYVWDTVFVPEGLGDTKLIISELGCDYVPSVTPAGKPSGAWKTTAPVREAEGTNAALYYGDMLRWCDERMNDDEDSFVAGAVVFCVGTIGQWGPWDIAGTDAEAYLINVISQEDNTMPDPEPIPPQPIPIPPTATNLLEGENWSFEAPWKDSEQWPMTTQDPQSWQAIWNVSEGSEFPNPIAPEKWPYHVGEALHIANQQLPPDEWDMFIQHGTWTYKIFAAHRSIWFVLMTTDLSLPLGEYLLTVPVWTDTYRWIKTEGGGYKDYSLEANHNQIMVKVNDKVVKNWTNLPAGSLQKPQATFAFGGGSCQLAIEVRCNWPEINNLWIDGLILNKLPVVTEPPTEPPMEHKAIIVKTPQDVTLAEWLQTADYSFAFRHTMTASHDDMLSMMEAGNEESFVKVAWPERQEDVIAMLEEAGYNWQPLWEKDTSKASTYQAPVGTKEERQSGELWE